MNDLTIVGRVTKEPLVKKSDMGTACYLTIAVNDGKEKTDYFNVKLFDKQAECCGRYVHKGDLVSVRGSVHLSRWGDSDQYSALSVDKAYVEFYGKRINPDGAMESADKGGDERADAPPSAADAADDPRRAYEKNWQEVEDEDDPFF